MGSGLLGGSIPSQFQGCCESGHIVRCCLRGSEGLDSATIGPHRHHSTGRPSVLVSPARSSGTRSTGHLRCLLLGKIDHRNNIADILEHRSSCDSSGIGSPLAEADPNPIARCSEPTAASRQVLRYRPVPAHIDSSHRQLHSSIHIDSSTSRQVLRSRRPGHPSTFSMLTPAAIVIPTASNPHRPAGSQVTHRAHSNDIRPCHRQPRPPAPSASRVDTGDPADSGQWGSISAGSRWHPGEPTGFGSVRGGPPLPHLRTHPCDPSRSLFYTVGYAGSPTL